MKNIFSFVLICTLFTIPIFAQHTVSGIVTDKKDNALLLEGVAVFIPEFHRYDVSKEGGTYILTNVGKGMVTLQFCKEGYRSVVNIINTKDSAVVLNVEMEKELEGEKHSTISLTNGSLSSSKPFSSQVISLNDLTKVDGTSLLSALNTLNGFDAVNGSSGISAPIIHGIDHSQIVIGSFGTQLLQSDFNEPYMLPIDPVGQSNIEVIKGPSALLYGVNSNGGAIIFQDEQPAKNGESVGDINLGFFTSTTGIKLDAGVKGTTQKGVFYSARAGSVSNTSYVQGLGQNAIKNTELSEFASNSKYSSTTGKATIGVSKKWGVSKLSYSYYSQKSGIVELTNFQLDETDPFQRERTFKSPFIEQNNHVISEETNYHFSKSSVRLNLSYQSSDKKETDPFSKIIDRTSYFTKFNALTYDVRYVSNPVNKFGVTVGIQGHHATDKNEGEESYLPNMEDNVVGALVSARYDIKKWNFLFAGRFDQQKRTLNSYYNLVTIDTLSNKENLSLVRNPTLINSSGGIVFHATNNLSIKANQSIATSTANARQLGAWGKNEANYSFDKGNSNLSDSRSFLSELTALLRMEELSIEVTGYKNKLTDYIYLSNTGQDTIITSDSLTVDTIKIHQFSQGNATINGIDLSLTYHPGGMKGIALNIGYSMLEAKLENGKYLPGIPTNKMVAGITLSGDHLNYIYKPYFNIVFSNYFEKTNVGENEMLQETYALLDLHIGGSFKWGKQFFEIKLNANNLLDTGYKVHNSSLAYLGTTGVRAIGRNVSIQLHIPFGLKSAK